ncbi:MAG: hypothetical protein JSV80_11585, partial [Acidobacteriota bacterium]
WDICFSTLPSEGGTIAFVTQGRWLTLVDVPTRTQRGRPWNVATLLGVVDADLRGCASAGPREFLDPASGPVWKTLLYLTANLPSGEARFVVLDQEQLLLAGGTPLVADDVLAASGEAVDVMVMDAPLGERFQRAWYTVSAPGSIDTVQVATDAEPSSGWQVTERQSSPLPTDQGLEHLEPGRPPCRELAVVPESTLGLLKNVETETTCPPGGDQVAVAVTGPGPNSYTVLSVNGATQQLHVINPNDCTERTRTLGANPVSIATLGTLNWQSAFVANRDDDTVTRTDNDGVTQTIPLTTVPPGAECVKCPVSVGVTLRSGCGTNELMLEKVDADNDGQRDDIRLSFSKSPVCGPVLIACECLDDPLCACRCDCGANPDPDCFCPGLLDMSLDGIGDTLALQPNWPIGEVPWKELGDTAGGVFDHLNAANPDDSWAYGAFGE